MLIYNILSNTLIFHLLLLWDWLPLNSARSLGHGELCSPTTSQRGVLPCTLIATMMLASTKLLTALSSLSNVKILPSSLDCSAFHYSLCRVFGNSLWVVQRPWTKLNLWHLELSVPVLSETFLIFAKRVSPRARFTGWIWPEVNSLVKESPSHT